MTADEFLDLVASGERPGVEFKNARSRTDRSFVEVVRAVLGMTNRRDGGVIVIGIDKDGTPTGLSHLQLSSWVPDHTRQSLAPFSDPYTYVDVEHVEVETAGPLQGKSFAVLIVHEFDDVPVLCAKGGKDAHGNEVLREGACYVRSRQMPATTEVADHAQFRELLDLATEKGVRRFLERARRAGLTIEGAAQQTDTERFEAERAGSDE